MGKKRKKKMKKEKRSRCTWVVGKKKRGGGEGISYGNIEGERNRMEKEGILGVVKKIK
jgi:hypothetical protein